MILLNSNNMEMKLTGFFLVHVEISVTEVMNRKYIEIDKLRRNGGNKNSGPSFSL